MLNKVMSNIIQPQNVDLNSDNEIYLKENDETETLYLLQKGAIDYIYGYLDLKYATSKEVYDKDVAVWRDLRDSVLNQAKASNGVELNDKNSIYLVNTYKELLDCYIFPDENSCNRFKDRHQDFTIETTTNNKTNKFFTDNEKGCVKLISYEKNKDIVKEDYVPAIILEMDVVKSVYSVCTGILVYKTFSFIPDVNNYYVSHSLVETINSYNIDNYLKIANENSESVYNMYNSFVTKNIEISARELTTLLKKAGYKLVVDDTNKLIPINKMLSEEANNTIQTYYNTFNEYTAQDILSLNDFRKTFMYNKITLVEVFRILSKEYLTSEENKITLQLLINIVMQLINYSTTDDMQVKFVKGVK